MIQDLAITAPRIWESYIKIMINLNYYFHKFLNLNFYSWSRIMTGRANNYLEAFQIIIFLVDIFVTFDIIFDQWFRIIRNPRILKLEGKISQ